MTEKMLSLQYLIYRMVNRACQERQLNRNSAICRGTDCHFEFNTCRIFVPVTVRGLYVIQGLHNWAMSGITVGYISYLSQKKKKTVGYVSSKKNHVYQGSNRESIYKKKMR